MQKNKFRKGGAGKGNLGTVGDEIKRGNEEDAENDS